MKTVNCIEAIKANREGKRVRIVGTDSWVVPKSFADFGILKVTQILSDWEIEDEPLVLWVNIYDYKWSGASSAHRSKEAADKSAGVDRIKCIKMVECRDE